MNENRATVVFKGEDDEWTVEALADEIRKLFGVFASNDFGMFINQADDEVIIEGPEIEILMLGSYFRDGVIDPDLVDYR